MGGRFDPVRDSVTRSPSSDDRRSASISEDMAAHRRQTTRSASIAEILNEGGQESAIPRSNSGTGYADHSISHSGQRVPSPMQYNAGSGHAFRNVSSPRSSISRYPDGPPGPAALSQRTSPRGSIIDLPSRERMPSYGRIHDPSPNTYVRQSSPTSMNPYHHQPSTSNIPPVPTLRTERSPSLHHILGPTSSMDEIRRPSSSSSSNTGLGPPYVSNQPSVSPVMGRHSRLSGEHIPGPSHLRAESMEMHPHHPHSGHYAGHSSSIRASSSSGSGGEFAVPDVPYRSPESMRGRVPLPPTGAPPIAHGSSPYGHPVRSSPLGVPARYPDQEGYGRPIPTDFLDDRYGGARPATPPSLPDARGHVAYQPYDRAHPSQQLHINTDHVTYHTPQTPPIGAPQTPYSSIAAQSPGRPPMTPGGFAPTPGGEYMGTPFFGRDKHVHMHSHSSSIGAQQAMDAEELEYRQRQMYQQQQHERRPSRDPMMEERARYEHERATYERTKVMEEEQMHARRMQEIREREDYEAHQRLVAQEEQANKLEQTRLARETEEQSKADYQVESRQASPPPKKRKSAASKNEKKQSASEINSKDGQSVPEALVDKEGAESSHKAESTKEITNMNGSSTEKKAKKNSVQTLPMDLKKPSEFASKKSAPTPVVKEDIREPEIVEIRKPSYKPLHRVSLPGTVRLPIILTELERLRIQCKNSLRQKWQEDNAGLSDGWDGMIAEIEASKSKIVDSNKDQAKKRKRNTTESSTTDKGEKENHATGNGNANSLVAAHYNARQDAGRDARKQSPIIDLKTFNNWVKSVLIQQHGKKGGRVFDIGGGKGGDLKKWDKCGIRELILADIAEVSVSQAKNRFMDQRHRYKADFFAMDCFGEPVENHVPEHLLSPLFDIVSLQFCLHYGWDNYSHANLMLDNIAKYLRSGGTFIATFPDCYELHSRLTQAVVRDSTAKSFGNAFYNVSFDQVNRSEDDHIQFEPFGQRYTFALTDAIDEVAEFVVDWRELEEMARQKGLRCIYHGNFANFWQEFGLQGGPFRNLADRFGIRTNQEIPMNEDLWEAVTIYAAVAFVKE